MASATLGLLCLVLATTLCPASPAERTEDDRVRAMMLSTEPKTRAIAFALGQSWMATSGDAGAKRYRAVLWAAWQLGERSFATAVRDGAMAAGLFRTGYANWRSLGREAIDAVHGELAESNSRLASLDERYDLASRSRMEVETRLARALEDVARIHSAGATVVEIETELAKVEAKPAGSSRSDRDASEAKPVSTLRERLNATLDGRAVLEAEADLVAARDLRDTHFEAAQFNREQAWAPPSARDFAKLLNGRRQALGLAPMRLERRLWEACATHAEEMQRLGYFDHESPTPGRRTPDRRAELAKFGGSFEGENLFQSRAPQAPSAVFRSWWASDSHRYVLFSGKPNALGLDPGGGTHWTLMTGKLN